MTRPSAHDWSQRQEVAVALIHLFICLHLSLPNMVCLFVCLFILGKDMSMPEPCCFLLLNIELRSIKSVFVNKTACFANIIEHKRVKILYEVYYTTEDLLE